MNGSVWAPRRQVPLLAQVDILVVGGGAAGVAAACAAAQSGSRVLLAERYGFCGGAAVAGLSGTICGMYTASAANRPEQVVFGFADRFIRDLQARGGATEPIQFGKTSVIVHDPLVWRETADAYLAGHGVQVLYHALCTGVIKEDGVLRGVFLETKEGPYAVRAGAVIDCSGDGDVAYQAGVEYVVGKEGQVQNPSMMFRMLNVDVKRLREALGPDTIVPLRVMQLIQDLNASGQYRLPRSKIFLFPTSRPGEVLCNNTRVTGADGRELNCALAADLSEAEVEGRRQMREYAAFLQEHVPGFEQAFVNDTGVQIGVRQTRSVVGLATLRNDDVVQGRKFATGIARSPWPIELHSGETPRLVWLEDDYYEIPFECLVPKTTPGLLVAGRCLSAEHEALASARVTAQCFAMGEAAGVAAHLAVRANLLPSQIGGEQVRQLVGLS